MKAAADGSEDLLPAKFDFKEKDPFVEMAHSRYVNSQEKDDTKWKKVHEDFMTQHGVFPSQLNVPPKLASNRWFKLLPSREKECVLVNNILHPRMNSCELSDQLPRLTVHSDQTRSTIMPRGKMFANGKLVSGGEALHHQGFPKQVLDAMLEADKSGLIKDGLTHNLAGNAMTGIIPSSLIISILAHLTAKQKDLLKTGV